MKRWRILLLYFSWENSSPWESISGVSQWGDIIEKQLNYSNGRGFPNIEKMWYILCHLKHGAVGVRRHSCNADYSTH